MRTPAAHGVTQRVGAKIDQYLFQQRRIAQHRRTVGAEAESEAELIGHRAEIMVDAIEQFVGRDRLDLGGDDAGLEA